jgi:putative ABC transport system permease protein
MSFVHELKVAARSLAHAKGLAITVIVTLALGVGANAAIFSVVRGVLLRPLVNRDEDRLIYIRQSAPGIGAENTTFSVPELQDLRGRVRTITAFGDFSTINFTMIGLGEPRVIRAGVVGGSYFEVMGLRPVIGRLLDASDDGPNAQGAAVLTHRFWTTAFNSDKDILGKTVRLGARSATIVGVLEPSVPYPAETELIANVVTSPHHLSATMVTGREHRMTELFGRLAPGVNLDGARAELQAVHADIVRENPGTYSRQSNFTINAVRLRDQITSRARTVLLVLLAASGLVFVVAVSNVANLILARTVRREGELSVRAALGASPRALRRTLLAESVLLCGTGAALGILSAQPMVSVLARYASRFSIRALDLTVDASILWVGAGLAIAAAVLLAYVPRLPSPDTSHGGPSITVGSVRMTGRTTGRLRLFAVTQIAASFMLLAGAGMLVKTLLALQSAESGFDTRNVLALDVPIMGAGRTPDQTLAFYRDVLQRITALPGVNRVAIGAAVPWRDVGNAGPGFQFTAEGYARADGEEDPRAQLRTVSSGFFETLGVPLVAGRDFNEGDRRGAETVVIVSESVARRMFPNQEVVNRRVMFTDPIGKFINLSAEPRRIVGVVRDIDDQNLVPEPTFTIYSAFDQAVGGGRLFVHAGVDPYSLVQPITRVIRDMSAEQPIERPAVLEDVRAEVLAPNRLNALVFGGFAAVAMAIAIVGVAGVLAFSVSGRTREFAIRLAVGSPPRHLLTGVLAEGAIIAVIGVAAGAAGGFALARVAAAFIENTQIPDLIPVAAAAFLLLAAAVAASLLPAARAARVDVMDALRAD